MPRRVSSLLRLDSKFRALVLTAFSVLLIEPVASMHITTSSCLTSGFATADAEFTVSGDTCCMTILGMNVGTLAEMLAVIVLAPLSMVKVADVTAASCDGDKRLLKTRTAVATRASSASFNREAASTAESAADCRVCRILETLL